MIWHQKKKKEILSIFTFTFMFLFFHIVKSKKFFRVKEVRYFTPELKTDIYWKSRRRKKILKSCKTGLKRERMNVQENSPKKGRLWRVFQLCKSFYGLMLIHACTFFTLRWRDGITTMMMLMTTTRILQVLCVEKRFFFRLQRPTMTIKEMWFCFFLYQTEQFIYLFSLIFYGFFSLLHSPSTIHKVQTTKDDEKNCCTVD